MLGIANSKVIGGPGIWTPGATRIGPNFRNLTALIRKIFTGGEQGFAYDPNDLTTLYQDAAGTIPVTAAGQAVGLILDKSKGLALGSNLIPNGSFSSNTAWGKGAGWTIADGVARFDGSAAFSNLGNTTPSSINGKWLRVELDLSNVGTLVTQVRILVSGALAATIPVSGAGKYSARVLGGSVPSIGIQSQGQSGANYAFTLDNVSVKEVLGNHAYQSTSAARPILQQTPILGNELIQDTEFNDPSYWNVAASGATSVSGGFARFNVAPTGNNVNRANAITLGKTYQLTFTISSISGGAIRPSISLGTASATFANFSKVGTYTVVAVASGTVPAVQITAIGDTTATVDRISVKEVLGYKTNTFIGYDGIDDKLITNLPSALTNCTVLRAIPDVGTQVKYNQTLPMLYEDSTNHAGLVAINRALTRKEQLRIMEELDKRAGATSLETLTFKTFDNNQEGFVYDPNDLSTMFQDAVGTVPVTAVGQPVGLIFDKRKGSATGINLHTPTTPMNATVYPATGTRSGLDITVSQEVSGYASVSLGMPTVVGKTYLLELIAPVVAGFWVLVSDNSSSDSANRRTAISTAPGSKINTKITFIFTASAAVTYIHLNRGTSVTSPATFKDVSVREVLGNHAYQTTSASRPILRQNAVTGANYLEFDGTDDFLQTAVPLSFPVTAVAPFDFKSNSLTKCILSAGNSGYLRSTETTASVFSSSGGSTVAKKKVDVLLHELTGDSVNIRSNSAAIAMRDTDSKNPYGPLQKYIGSFSDTHTTLRAAMDLYGMVVVRKLLSASEEAELRAHFNKRMGI